MNVKKFVAANAREVLRKVKETLGQDAIILSNRSLPGGVVEIMAVAARDMASIASPVEENPPPRFAAPLRDEDDAYQVTLSRPLHASLLSHAEHIVTARTASPPARPAPRPAVPPPVAPAAVPTRPAARPAAPARPIETRDVLTDNRADKRVPLVNAGIPKTPALRDAQKSRPVDVAVVPTAIPDEVLDEIRSLRKIVEQHLAGFVWGEAARNEPIKTEVLRRMLEAGFSPRFTRELLADLPPEMDIPQALAWSRGVADRSLSTAPGDLIDKGGVYALTGPTGVGKTTTTAKLAARCVLRHGANRVALVTTDSYRIGAYEQLRIYGRILGVAVYLAKDAEELQQVLGELAGKHMVLIDTMGMSQKDKLVRELNDMLSLCGVRRLLLLSATARGDTLDDVVRAYRGDDLAGCVLTKIDEATTLAPSIDAIIRHNLQLDYVSNGQRVPEDLHLPNRVYLLHRAFKDTPESTHRLAGLEPGLVMANAGLFATDTAGARRG
ncbi:MAG: flagellar biosynthesis protein FlhF [Zoogloeaceae bacterium]|jgi:flagellar biosynthesis protein FlhF|nr:flagellar biosynthesis protein FlhF [Zoogloeaceae bacterium]